MRAKRRCKEQAHIAAGMASRLRAVVCLFPSFLFFFSSFFSRRRAYICAPRDSDRRQERRGTAPALKTPRRFLTPLMVPRDTEGLPPSARLTTLTPFSALPCHGNASRQRDMISRCRLSPHYLLSPRCLPPAFICFTQPPTEGAATRHSLPSCRRAATLLGGAAFVRFHAAIMPAISFEKVICRWRHHTPGSAFAVVSLPLRYRDAAILFSRLSPIPER